MLYYGRECSTGLAPRRYPLGSGIIAFSFDFRLFENNDENSSSGVENDRIARTSKKMP